MPMWFSAAVQALRIFGQYAVFDDLMQLSKSEQEQLHHLLQSAQKGSPHLQ
jgi:hypothetical protein